MIVKSSQHEQDELKSNADLQMIKNVIGSVHLSSDEERRDNNQDFLESKLGEVNLSSKPHSSQ